MDRKIRKFVYRVRARLREQKIIENIIKFVEIGLLIAVFLSCISMVVPFYYAVPAAVGIVGVCFAAGLVIGIYKTPAPMEAALRADSKGHKEKISTAFFLEGKEDSFSMLQKKDAWKVMEDFQIRKEFPIKLPVRRVLILAGLLIVFVISSLAYTPARESAEVKKNVEKEAGEEIARLEKVEKRLVQDRGISETEEIREQLENAKREIAQAASGEELKKAVERMAKKMEMAGEKTENQILRNILQESAEEIREAAENKESELAEEAENALEKAEKGNRREKQDAYKKLKKLADATGDDTLKKAAQDYKDSGYSDSDYAGAQQALNEALDNNAADRTDLAEQNNSQSGNSGHDQKNGQGNGNQNNGNGQGNGNQNNGNGQGNGNQNSGNGQGNGNQNSGNGQGNAGENGNGSGAGNGSGNGGGMGNGSGGGWNHGGKEGREGNRKTDESITVPVGENGDDGNLTGKADGNGSSTKEKSSRSQTWSGNKVSYGEVSGKYKEKAYKKVNGSRYPGKLKNKIRDYFDGLN